MSNWVWRKSSYSNGNNANCVEVGWRKSSFSEGGNNNCVEVALSTEAVGVRDSKNPTAPNLIFDRSTWLAFIDRTFRVG